ncbi:helix-turn-helix domain-containing protein [Microbacterium hominis]|uniref:Helix-turn-helix transcriptional regulator n=1 Tax=Microbacterium hominis TaxID=162426 RepID=A0A7D4TLN0_9MICO|nr:helix-turn-helix transcriptional regulator [Microbacterium hominis]QKJ18402.1 helix-turn-helix transcriptional regulator [Microbacterium hominis]
MTDPAAGDLLALAVSAWRHGRVVECFRALEDAFRDLRAADDLAAADVALLAALLRFTTGEVTVATAWTRRAARILAPLADRPAHAYLVYLEAGLGLEGGEAWSAQSAARLAELDAALGDPAVATLSAVVAGMRGLRTGDPATGFAHLDEAMLGVVAGELAPEWAGDALCTTIHACHELADYRRMADWTRATEEWGAHLGDDAVYAGVCRVHRLELRSAAGDWTGAEAALQRTCADLVAGEPWIAGEGWYQLGELRRLRGDASGAVQAYALARDAGVDPAPGEALLALDAGDPARAWALLRTALAARDRLGRVRLLRAGVRIALERDDRDEAARLLAELEAAAADFASDGFRAWAAHARGMVLLAAVDHDGALRALHGALDRYRRLGLRWEQAHALTWIAGAHEARGEAAAAAQVRDDAAAILDALGAAPIRLPAPATPPVGVGPLTARESEILDLVARGASNREIAQRLFISEKTVGRHLANTYLKLDVSSRTAAAAWWHARDGRGIH